MQFWIVQTFNGLSYGALLFLLASGLSLIFGVMRIVNLAHGSDYLLGGYLALTASYRAGFLTAIACAVIGLGLVGVAMERLLLRRLQQQPLPQVLMTMGCALVFQDLALLIWGGDPYILQPASMLTGSIATSIGVFQVYRMFLIALAIL